jgi:hypothetical protein
MRLALALLLTLSVALPSVADARRRRKPAVLSQGEKAFARGKRLFKERDFLAALEAFEEAYRLKPHFLMQCNIARCLERLADFVRSARHYRQCLQEGASRTPAGAKIKATLAQVEGRITWVLVRSPGKGGTIYVDGKSVGAAPLRLALNPGDRSLEVRRRDATPASQTIASRGGETLTVDLSPVDRSTPPEVVTPRPDRREEDRPVRVAPPTRRKGIHQAVFWTTVGITIGCVVAAAVTGAQALQLRDDYEANPTREGYNNAKDRRLMANIFWGATAAMAGVGTTVFFFTDFRRAKADDQGSTAWGVGVRGTF